ncbi:hypothetical protein EWM64_g444 [Hericium alpestre]|uniref:Succinate dehydrogenase assembly factor 4, mitochondrial n=1 Tax=Hericium alpestre TaxID=135208 RepID=A0A4Z0A929_9AGAM|nr:hypothetical protein EWM64_g444 [Hericium alpestre]
MSFSTSAPVSRAIFRHSRLAFAVHHRWMSSLPPRKRPSPPPLPPSEQREFEELVRKAQGPSISQNDLHPDTPAPLKKEFEGDVNPITGERGGPKREPVNRWSEDGGDWSFKGRVSDF